MKESIRIKQKDAPSSRHGAEGAGRNEEPFLFNGIALDRTNYTLFFNRELSWIEFNFRVLEEAARDDNPLLERLKFLSISESNLDEFFMVRVAGLKQVMASAVNEIQMDGKTPRETLQAISVKVHEMVTLQYRLYSDILQGLNQNGIQILESFTELHAHEKEHISSFFNRELFPVLTPMAVDPGHPFPHIANGRLNQAMVLERKGGEDKPREIYAFVEVPSVFPRLMELPAKRKVAGEIPARRFLPLEEILKMHAKDLFAGTTVKSMHGFSITRNSDLSIDEVASDNLLSTIEDELKNRMWGEAVRLNYRRGMPESIREFLRDKLELEPGELYERPGLLNLQDLMVVCNSVSEAGELKDVPFIPKNPIPRRKPEQIFDIMQKKDILLHHPYDSFQPIVDLLAFAARDPQVLAIKQTLYRTSGNSPIVRSLIEAAENGKQVTALVELKARFDEENNIVWARQMEKHGVHVIYGLVGLKIHGKMLQIIRRENNEVKSYVHLSTGNYNPTTAKIYTDIGLLTVDPDINMDATKLFHALTGYSAATELAKLSAAPVNLRETLTELVQTEIGNAKKGKPSGIRLKLNALVDSEMILLLYQASLAGVKIELNVRGICCLKPGIQGLSENIQVTSIVGRFLEHSRIFYFENGGDPRLFLSSADWMPRNLNRRVEIMFPVQDPDHKTRLIGVLNAIFQDNHNSRRLLPDGSYIRIHPGTGEQRFSSQRFFREEANKEFEQKHKDRVDQRKTVFQPVTNPDMLGGAEEMGSNSRPSADTARDGDI